MDGVACHPAIESVTRRLMWPLRCVFPYTGWMRAVSDLLVLGGEIMALQDFWLSVRTAARLFSPRAIVDSTRLDDGTIERTLRGATLWLTRGAVAGFDAADFPFLPAPERAHLADHVAEFREVAAAVNPTAPAPREAVERALPLFAKIVKSLEFDRFEDPEAYRLGKTIEREIAPYRPPELAELRFRTGWDHTGDPGLWIYAFLGGSASGSDEAFLGATPRLRKWLAEVARQVAPDRFPYISFRDLAEEEDEVEAVEAS